MANVTAIIPFYNEKENILTIIAELSKIHDIDQIICVDDGSTNNIAKIIKEHFSHITLLTLPQNRGKAQAVFEGLNQAKNDLLLLMDADLVNIHATEIENILTKYKSIKPLDMVILEIKGKNKVVDTFLRKYIFQGGNRLLHKSDLEEVYKGNPTGYQLEVAINNYAIENNKIVKWAKCTALNPHKTKKIGFFNGLRKDLKMDLQIISYLGLVNYLKQMLFFCRDELK